MLVLEQDNTKKRQINKFVPEFEVADNKKYELKAIRNNIIYAKKADKHLLRLYYLVV